MRERLLALDSSFSIYFLRPRIRLRGGRGEGGGIIYLNTVCELTGKIQYKYSSSVVARRELRDFRRTDRSTDPRLPARDS